MTFCNQLKTFVFRNGIYLFLALLIAFGLKYHYSKAGSDDLDWILAPTAKLVEMVSGVQFDPEQHTGYVAQNRRIIIAPSCAGINFMLMAFCMAVFCGINYLPNTRVGLAWMATCLASSYLLTLVVNTARIVVSMYVYDADIYSTWITPQRVHRLEGTIIYFFALRVFYIIIAWMRSHFAKGFIDIRRTGNPSCGADYGWRRWMGAGLVPLFWYGLIALGIPFLNPAGKSGLTRLIEHSWMVISGCSMVFILLFLIQLGYRRIKDFSRR